jgi:hypothetical protein
MATRKKAPPKLALVKGGRPTARSIPTSETTRRVTFIPREDGSVLCICSRTRLVLHLLASVEVTVPDRICNVEKLE